MIETILKRRSIRRYQQKTIPGETIEQLLKCAMSAPSAGNQQAWSFLILNKHDDLVKLMPFSPYAGMLKEAAAAIVVCGDISMEKFPGFWVQDCAAATENILLAATSLGIGSVWLAAHPLQERVDFIRNLFGIPDNVIPLSVVALGYPAETKDSADRYLPNRVHYEKW